MSEYDFLIVGAGLYGATFARLATDDGYKCLVIDRRPNVAGNVYTEDVHGINVHKYGAHIFHTSDKEVWEFANKFADFNRYTNCVVANYKGELYSMPFNMYTFNKMWGVVTPAEARAKLDEQIAMGKVDEPKNLEEQAISLIGPDIYNIQNLSPPRIISNFPSLAMACRQRERFNRLSPNKRARQTCLIWRVLAPEG